MMTAQGIGILLTDGEDHSRSSYDGVKNIILTYIVLAKNAGDRTKESKWVLRQKGKLDQ